MRLWFTVFVLLLSALPAFAGELRGRVVGIADGDTLTLLVDGHDQYRIRLAEIDAPEKRQPFGQRSRQILSDYVFGKTIRVVTSGRDRYGREIGRVFAQRKTTELDVNAEMVKQGAAWVFDRYATDDSLYDLQDRAKKNRVGLWALPATDQVAPWTWRKAKAAH
jgi:micrococcal nuclease